MFRSGNTVGRSCCYRCHRRRRFFQASSLSFSPHLSKQRQLISNTSEISSIEPLQQQLQKQIPNEKERKQLLSGRTKAVILTTASTTALLVWAGYERRAYRNREKSKLPAVTRELWMKQYPDRDWENDVILTVQRMGLMGSKSSVKSELDTIRHWHQQRGFKGGLVVRDLTRGLFFEHHDDDNGGDDSNTNQMRQQKDWTLTDIIEDPTRLERRECYYIYYEIEPTGRVVQQIFCRGTTLIFDVLTCIQAWMVYDPELQCSVHRGFLNHANRILQDVLPLLAAPSDRRSTVELCGHSLGGAVATILAAKLQKRGYRVVRLTTVGEPRFLKSCEDVETIRQRLPTDHLRIESDLDFVPFLPPLGVHACNKKIWFSSNNHRDDKASAYLISCQEHFSWTDSVWTNFRAREILANRGRAHRIPSYVKHLSGLQ